MTTFPLFVLLIQPFFAGFLSYLLFAQMCWALKAEQC